MPKGALYERVATVPADAEDQGITIEGPGTLRSVFLEVDGVTAAGSKDAAFRTYIDNEPSPSTDASVGRALGFGYGGTYLGQDRDQICHDERNWAFTYIRRFQMPFSGAIRVTVKNNDGTNPCAIVLLVEAILD